MPTDNPSGPNRIDEILKDIYGPAKQEQLNRELPLLNMIAQGSRPVITPTSRWFHFKWELRHRINDIYMHARYGYCDDAKEYDDHIC